MIVPSHSTSLCSLSRARCDLDGQDCAMLICMFSGFVFLFSCVSVSSSHFVFSSFFLVQFASVCPLIIARIPLILFRCLPSHHVGFLFVVRVSLPNLPSESLVPSLFTPHRLLTSAHHGGWGDPIKGHALCFFLRCCPRLFVMRRPLFRRFGLCFLLSDLPYCLSSFPMSSSLSLQPSDLLFLVCLC